MDELSVKTEESEELGQNTSNANIQVSNLLAETKIQLHESLQVKVSKFHLFLIWS